MKVTVKYDGNMQDIIPDLKKEYEVYVSETGYPVVEILRTEIPLFGMKTQRYEMFYKVPKELISILSPDDNRVHKFWLTINSSDEVQQFALKTMNKKRKEQAKKEEEEKLAKKQKLVDALTAGKERKKAELAELEGEEIE